MDAKQIAKIRDEFYLDLVRSTEFTADYCRELLKDEFGENFDPERISDYRSFLQEKAQYRRDSRALQEIRTRVRQRLSVGRPMAPCPIPGCKGVQEYSRVWTWTCSIGGLRHRLATGIAKVSGMPAAELLERVEQEASTAKVYAGLELMEWKKGVNDEASSKHTLPIEGKDLEGALRVQSGTTPGD